MTMIVIWKEIYDWFQQLLKKLGVFHGDCFEKIQSFRSTGSPQKTKILHDFHLCFWGHYINISI